MKASMPVTRRRVVLGIAASSFLISDRAVLATGVAVIKALKPGEFIWRPELSPHGPVVIVVSCQSNSSTSTAMARLLGAASASSCCGSAQRHGESCQSRDGFGPPARRQPT